MKHVVILKKGIQEISIHTRIVLEAVAVNDKYDT